MTFVVHSDPTMNVNSLHLYVPSWRWVRRSPEAFLEFWSDALVLGQPLPKLPLWLAESFVLPLDLEQSYEQTCRDLWIA